MAQGLSQWLLNGSCWSFVCDRFRRGYGFSCCLHAYPVIYVLNLFEAHAKSDHLQRLLGRLAGILFDFTDSYILPFTIFAFAAAVAAGIIACARPPRLPGLA